MDNISLSPRGTGRNEGLTNPTCDVTTGSQWGGNLDSQLPTNVGSQSAYFGNCVGAVLHELHFTLELEEISSFSEVLDDLPMNIRNAQVYFAVRRFSGVGHVSLTPFMFSAPATISDLVSLERGANIRFGFGGMVPAIPMKKVVQTLSDKQKAFFSSLEPQDLDFDKKSCQFLVGDWKGDAAKGLKPRVHLYGKSKGKYDGQTLHLSDFGFSPEQVEAIYHLHVMDKDKARGIIVSLIQEQLLAFGNEKFLKIKELETIQPVIKELQESPSTPSVVRKAFQWDDKLIVHHPLPVDKVTAHEEKISEQEAAEKRGKSTKREYSPEPLNAKDFTSNGVKFKAGEVSSLATPKMIKIMAEYKRLRKNDLAAKAAKLQALAAEMDLPESGNDDIILWCSAIASSIKNSTPEYRAAVAEGLDKLFVEFKKGRKAFFKQTFGAVNYAIEKVKSGFIALQNLPPVKDKDGNIVEMGYGRRVFEVGASKTRKGVSFAMAAAGKAKTKTWDERFVPLASKAKQTTGNIITRASQWVKTKYQTIMARFRINRYESLGGKEPELPPIRMSDRSGEEETEDEYVLRIAQTVPLPEPTLLERVKAMGTLIFVSPIQSVWGWLRG